MAAVTSSYSKKNTGSFLSEKCRLSPDRPHVRRSSGRQWQATVVR